MGFNYENEKFSRRNCIEQSSQPLNQELKDSTIDFPKTKFNLDLP